MLHKYQLAERYPSPVAVVSVLALMASNLSMAAASDADNKQLCLELTTLFRSARAVISANQALINDATKGDKGLHGDAVVATAKENYQKARSEPFPQFVEGTDDSLANQARVAMLQSIKEIMDENQGWINEKDKGFKGFLPAVFAKMVADRFSKKMSDQMYIKLTAPKEYVRNRANRPDKWEQRIIQELFRSADHKKGEIFTETAPHKGRTAFRLILPEYYKESCLKCHGEPKGSRDITGGKKEGGKLGELGGAISVGIYE